MKQYLDGLRDVLYNGHIKEDRTGTGTLSKFGTQARYCLRRNKLPVVTTKRIHLHSIVHELLWMLSGSTNVKYLQDNGVRIWNEWANEDGDLGPVYGKQWRDFNGVDQIQELIKGLLENPEGRRHIVSAWNPAELPEMALPPCHTFFQFYMRKLTLSEHSEAWDYMETEVRPEYGISCQLYQRSADKFLGEPFNITFYSLLTHMVAKQVNAYPLEFIHSIGDAHIYSNHVQQVAEQITREPLRKPTVRINPKPTIFDYTADDIEIVGYEHLPHIAGKVAV